MTTLEHVKQQETKAKQEKMSATAEVEAARAALAETMQARATAAETPAPPGDEDSAGKRAELDTAVLTARSRVANAGHAMRQADEALREAAERAARLVPHAETLAKLDRALAAVRARDAAITDAGVAFHAKLGELLGDLRESILAADRLWTSLPADVRFADIDAPRTAAHFAGVDPQHPRLLSLVEVAVARRMEGEPAAPARSVAGGKS